MPSNKPPQPSFQKSDPSFLARSFLERLVAHNAERVALLPKCFARALIQPLHEMYALPPSIRKELSDNTSLLETFKELLQHFPAIYPMLTTGGVSYQERADHLTLLISQANRLALLLASELNKTPAKQAEKKAALENLADQCSRLLRSLLGYLVFVDALQTEFLKQVTTKSAQEAAPQDNQLTVTTRDSSDVVKIVFRSQDVRRAVFLPAPPTSVLEDVWGALRQLQSARVRAQSGRPRGQVGRGAQTNEPPERAREEKDELELPRNDLLSMFFREIVQSLQEIEKEVQMGKIHAEADKILQKTKEKIEEERREAEEKRKMH